MDIASSFILACVLSLFRCVASMYTNYSLDMKEVCPLNFKIPELTVGKENLSSVIITDGNYFRRWNGHNAFDCKFLLRASFALGIMGVIQNMNLRKNETTGECIDFIQFGIPKGKYTAVEFLFHLDLKKDKWLDHKICGEISSLNRLELDSLKKYSIKNKEGDLYVNIHIERKPLPFNTTLRLEIVFTSYKECRNSDGTYRMCDNSICIHKNYFGDMVINCPECKDESSCLPIILDNSGDPELNTKVTVTAVTSIFLSFFLFLGCMMLCRYFLLFRQWHQPPQVTTVEMTPPPEESTPAPTAPAETSDKDLPPAYETLFPDR